MPNPPVAKKLFRQSAMQRLSSPEQLDQLMRITSPKGWMALLAIAILVIGALCWGIWGFLPTEVNGAGILMKDLGIYTISAPANGRLDRVLFAAGDTVQAGETVAAIGQPDMANTIVAARQHIQQMEAQLDELESFDKRQLSMQQASVKQQQLSLNVDNQALQNQVDLLNQRLKEQKKLVDMGLITKDKMIATTESINQFKQQIRENQNQIKLLAIKQAQSANDTRQKAITLADQIENKRNILQGLEARIDRNTEVISFFSGEVFETYVDPGAQVTVGAPIMTLQLSSSHAGPLESILFISAQQGEKIRPGMTAHISPATVEKDKYGSILGLVTFVSQFPASPKAMQRVLQDQKMVAALSLKGAPVEIRVELLCDPDNPSGYQWTSSKGPPLALQAGTVCSCSIVTKRERPVTLIIPYLRKFFQGQGSA